MDSLEVEGLVSERPDAVLFHVTTDGTFFMSWGSGHGACGKVLQGLLTTKREICIQEGRYEAWIEFSEDNAQKIHDWYQKLTGKS